MLFYVTYACKQIGNL